jgi:endogenous inhibitor of DNA gyrase (YacG/DUF329 family)
MANKQLDTMRNKKDRAEVEYSEALREAVVRLRRQHPMWTLQLIANAMGVSRERIRQLLKSESMPTAAAKEPPVTGPAPHAEIYSETLRGMAISLTCGSCGKAFERLARAHRYNQKRGLVQTYCTRDCQRVGFGEWQHERGGDRTTCSLGHFLTPKNVILTTTTSVAGLTYKGRRCRTCRNAYQRAYYHRNKQQLTEAAVNDISTE